MLIEQAGYREKRSQAAMPEAGKGIADYVHEDNMMQGIAGTYGKSDGMSISESGSVHMEDATYLRPNQEKEKKTAVEQMESNESKSVEDRRNQMAVLSNTTSPEDYAKMQESGFSLSETDSHTIVTVTDKIKAVLAKAGVDISIYGDTLSEEQLEEITGNSAVAGQIAQILQENDLPLTSENMEDAQKTYVEASSLTGLNEEAIGYLIRNGLPPTVRNIYCAEYSSTEGNEGKPLSDADFEAMKEQIGQIITNAGLPVNQETLADCKWLIQNNLPLTEENLLYMEQLKTLSAQLTAVASGDEPDQFIFSAMAEAIAEGKRPSEGLLVPGYSFKDQAESAMEVIQNVQDEDLAYCIENGEELTIANLKTAIANRGKQAVSREGLSLLTARRQLEEVRLAMSAEANYALLKKGISIDTKPLVELVEDLKAQEDQYYRDLLEQEGVAASSENVAVFAETTEVISDLKGYPAYVLDLANEEDTLHTLHEAGSALKDTFEKANESYEALMTTPRADMGDSIQKAFRNVDDILKDLDMETSDANRRAVRILAYNQTEITPENIALMKAKDEEVQRAFQNMSPKVTLEMIRRGMNPLDMDISELNHAAEEIKTEIGDTENERFSKYLWKLEQNQSISEEERSAYIGIYRLIAQVEKTDGAVIGSLLNQGADITMRSLLTAVRSGKKGTMDYRVDEEFQGTDAVWKGPRIDEQIEMAFQQNCVHDIMDHMTPEALEAIPQENWENMTPEQFKEALQQYQAENEENDAALEAQYGKEQLAEFSGALSASDDVYAFLERYDLPNSISNIIAVEQMMRNPNQMFESLWKAKMDSFDKMEEIKKLKEQVLERFGEAVESPEELADAQETLADVAEHVMQNMIIENETVSTLDIRSLRMMSRQFSICAKQTQEESYMIPMQTGDSVTGVSLKIIRGTKEKGLVDIFFGGDSMGKVAASFEAKDKGISGMIAADDEETRRLISDNLGLLAEKLGGEEAVDLRVALVPDLSLEHYAANSDAKRSRMSSEEETSAEKNPVQTRRLYHIAEGFIQSMKELMN